MSEVVKMQYPIEVFVNNGGTITLKSEDCCGVEQMVVFQAMHVKVIIDAIQNCVADIEQSDQIEEQNG